MQIIYENRKTPEQILADIPPCTLRPQQEAVVNNCLIHGENLMVLKYLLQEKKLSGKIDLVYIDPPFATQNTFAVSEGRANTISYSRSGKVAYQDKLEGAKFLEFLRERLYLIKYLLSENGSIYLHIDYKIGHYVKIIMDEVFGIDNFRNDITRIKCNPKNFKRKGYGNIKDLILFYSKGKNPIWNEPHSPYTEADIKRLFPKIDTDGRRYTTIPLHAPGETQNGKTSHPFKGIYPPKGRHWRSEVKVLEEWDKDGLIEWSSTGNPRKKIFVEDRPGKRVQDLWEFKDPQYPVYPTEKHSGMLDLIVNTSSNSDSIVLDCFCGSGTTLRAAQKFGRRWIGIDESEEAIKAAREKLSTQQNNLFSSSPVSFEVYHAAPSINVEARISS